MFATLEELKEFLGLEEVETVESQLLLSLNAADSFIKTFTNRTLISTRFNHNVTAFDSRVVVTPEFPVTAIHGMTAYQSIDDTVGYPVNMSYVRYRSNGLIYSSEGLFVPSVIGGVLIDYTAGYDPQDTEYEVLKWITLEVAGQFFRGRGLMNIESYQTGGAQLKKFRPDEFCGIFGPEVVSVLSSFAVRGPRSVDR